MSGSAAHISLLQGCYFDEHLINYYTTVPIQLICQQRLLQFYPFYLYNINTRLIALLEFINPLIHFPNDCITKGKSIIKCSHHRTIRLSSYTGKIVACILSKRLESKIKEDVEKDQFGFRKGKGTRGAIRLMKIISERVLDVKEEICICFIHWQMTVLIESNCCKCL